MTEIATMPNPGETPVARYQRLARSRADLLDVAEHVAHAAQAHAGEVWHLHKPEHEGDYEVAMRLSVKATTLFNEVAAYAAAIRNRPAGSPS